MEGKRKTVTTMEEASDGLHEKQKHGRRHDIYIWLLGLGRVLLAI